ncbi:MAG: porin family protein [Chitinophagales bacterium]
MKKTIITLTSLLFFMYAVNAQKASIGFTAGASLANYEAKEDGTNGTDKSKPGFTAGFITNIPTGKNFMIQTGAHWVQKGTIEKDDNGSGGTDKISLTVNSIEIPVNFLFNSKGFFIGAGPSASFAVSGKLKANDVSVKAKFGNSDDDVMKGFDFGANILSGYQSAGGFLIMANFNQGFSNLVPGGSNNGTLKSHYFGIRIGYVLKGKKS